jgi:hypothetical protein
MQKVEVPAKRAVKFKVGRLMRESVEMPPQPVRTVSATSPTVEVKPAAPKAAAVAR